MNDRRKPPRSGGVIVALSIAVGLAVGVAMNQPSIGVLAGAAIGFALLAIIWLADRR